MQQPELTEDERRELAPYQALMDAIVSNVRVAQAAQVGTRAVDFVRGKDVIRWVEGNEATVQKTGVSTVDALALGCKLVDLGFLRRAERADIHNIRKDIDAEVRKPSKFPRKLQVVEEQSFDAKGYFVITYDGSARSNHFVLAAVVVVVLFFCMFPAWPLRMKMGGWYISVVLMTFILFLVVLRLVLFVLCWFGGADFWLYPNLFADDLGPIDSFRPLYTWLYRDDDWVMIVARLFLGALSVAACFKLGETHSLRDIGQFGRQQFLDVIDWGYQKLDGSGDEVAIIDGVKVEKPLNEFLDEEGTDFSCMLKCRFSSWIDVRDECLYDCECAMELIAGPCYRRCSEEAKRKIDAIHRSVCVVDSDSFDGDDDTKELRDDL